ncbi:MAG: hypothetical protein IJ366_00355 [Clostridia bacterium]|nr:hypothetical protein [Clostridia bacterium]
MKVYKLYVFGEYVKTYEIEESDTANNFDGYAKAEKKENPYDESCYLYFKLWEKNGKKRIYINTYKRRTLGYIDVTSGEIIIEDRQGSFQNEIETALSNFLSKYEIAE